MFFALCLISLVYWQMSRQGSFLRAASHLWADRLPRVRRWLGHPQAKLVELYTAATFFEFDDDTFGQGT